MALPTTFGPLTAATGAELDNNFAAVGALATQQCTATGTNSIVLTPVANQPTVNGYGLPNPLKFGFAAPASSSGSVTLEVGAFGFLPVYTSNGVQATSGTLASGVYYEVTYSTAAIYNSGNGAWVLSSYQPATGVTAVSAATVRGLSIANNAGTPDTKIDISFTQGCLVSAVGAPAFLGILSATIDLTTGTVTSTANGMDGESRPASGWVYIYAISTGAGMAGLGTTVSPLSGPPTLPATYTFYAYLGAMRCDGSSKLVRNSQKGNKAQYIVSAAQTTVLPTMTSGAQGSPTVPTWIAIAVAGFVPPTAETIALVLNNGTSGSRAACAPNNLYGGTNSATNPPPLTSANTGNVAANSGVFYIESANVYYAADVGGLLQCFGWTDYISAAGG